jgi:hypothetical protein
VILIELAALVSGVACHPATSLSFRAPHPHPLGGASIVARIGIAMTWTDATLLPHAGVQLSRTPDGCVPSVIQEPQVPVPGVAVLGKLP